MSTDAERRQRFESVAADVFEPLARYLRRRAAAEDAADAFGDAMLTIWRRLDDVPSDDPLPWCYGVARRCLANQRRATGRRLRLVERAAVLDFPTLDASGGDPQAAIERTDPGLAAALTTLTEPERDVVTLWAWERLEPREIAQVLDTTPNAVSVALSRAKRKLARRLGDRGQEPVRSGQEGNDGDAEPGRRGR